MMKIYVTGSTGSGKTTTAMELSHRYCIPAYILDEIVWDNSEGFSGKRHPGEVRDGTIADMLGMPSWVAEGIYYNGWMLPVLRAVDFVLVLTPPRFVRDYRLVKRYIHSKFQNDRQKESLAQTYRDLTWGHAYERDKMPGLIGLLDREGIDYYLYSGNNAAEYLSEEIL